MTRTSRIRHTIQPPGLLPILPINANPAAGEYQGCQGCQGCQGDGSRDTFSGCQEPHGGNMI
ncbi:MAG: hypothetical protein GX052_06520 [Syntrophomonadaceae bacterium]|nr:hypothetical protein [Syntrophomonadaceae bacterium]